MSFGEPHEHHERLESTNTRARELAAEGAPHGTVVTAGEQTAELHVSQTSGTTRSVIGAAGSMTYVGKTG